MRVLRAAAKKMGAHLSLSVQECIDRYQHLQQLEDMKRDGSFYELPEDTEAMTSEQRRKSVARHAARNRRLATAGVLAAASREATAREGAADDSSAATTAVAATAAAIPALYKVQGGYCARPYLWSDDTVRYHCCYCYCYYLSQLIFEGINDTYNCYRFFFCSYCCYCYNCCI